MKINPVNSNQNIEFEGNKAVSQKTGSIFDEQNQENSTIIEPSTKLNLNFLKNLFKIASYQDLIALVEKTILSEKNITKANKIAGYLGIEALQLEDYGRYDASKITKHYERITERIEALEKIDINKDLNITVDEIQNLENESLINEILGTSNSNFINKQGNIGDCWLLAAVQGITKFPDIYKEIVKDNGDSYTVTFYGLKDLENKPIKIDVSKNEIYSKRSFNLGNRGNKNIQYGSTSHIAVLFETATVKAIKETKETHLEKFNKLTKDIEFSPNTETTETIDSIKGYIKGDFDTNFFINAYKDEVTKLTNGEDISALIYNMQPALDLLSINSFDEYPLDAGDATEYIEALTGVSPKKHSYMDNIDVYLESIKKDLADCSNNKLSEYFIYRYIPDKYKNNGTEGYIALKNDIINGSIKNEELIKILSDKKIEEKLVTDETFINERKEIINSEKNLFFVTSFSEDFVKSVNTIVKGNKVDPLHAYIVKEMNEDYIILQDSHDSTKTTNIPLNKIDKELKNQILATFLCNDRYFENINDEFKNSLNKE